MSEAEKKRLLDEAAQIFLRLRETPDDPEVLARKEAFLARGSPEREAYARIVDGWAVSGSRHKPQATIPDPDPVPSGASADGLFYG